MPESKDKQVRIVNSQRSCSLGKQNCFLIPNSTLQASSRLIRIFSFNSLSNSVHKSVAVLIIKPNSMNCRAGVCPVQQAWPCHVTMVTPTNLRQTSLINQDALLSLALMWPHNRPLQGTFDSYNRTIASAMGCHLSASLESQGTPFEIFVPLHLKIPLESIVSCYQSFTSGWAGRVWE